MTYGINDIIERPARLKFGCDEFLAYAICEAAAQYWDRSDPYDFCLQSFGGDTIVFGGTNRLIWSPRMGFTPDPSYCTDRFLRRCTQLGRLPQ